MNKIIRKEKNAIENEDIQLNSSKKLDINEGFDGIRKSNSRVIFGILLGIIILDFAYECWN